MARYIDADALIENIKRVYCTDCNNYNEVRCRACGTDDAMTMIDDAPTVDVVPRERFDRVFGNLKAVLEERAEDKAEVAREIFAEADNIFMATCLSLETYKAWRELKKKYTEE